MINKCIICGNRKLKSIIEINNAPAYAQRLLNKNEIKKDKKIPLTLIFCSKCKLCQLKKDSFVGRNYYNNYSWLPVSYSKQMLAYQKWLAKDFVKYFNLKGESVFEIGCGDGMFASFLNKNGLKTIGIEPSTSLYNLAKKKIKVLNQFLNKKTSLKKKYYSAFVSRQVFEHLGNPNQILKDAKLYLKPGGVGLIEVPSFSTIMENNRYYDIYREHVAYYTKDTLQYLLAINNFEVIKIFNTANNEYLTAYFKHNDWDSELKLFSANYISYKDSIQKLFNLYKNKKIAVWGAGGKGMALLSMCNISANKDILFVIDSDPQKQGKYTTGSHILIKSPKEVNFLKLDLIVISAVMYQKEIIKDLKSKYNYKNKIALIAPKPHII